MIWLSVLRYTCLVSVYAKKTDWGMSFPSNLHRKITSNATVMYKNDNALSSSLGYVGVKAKKRNPKGGKKAKKPKKRSPSANPTADPSSTPSASPSKPPSVSPSSHPSSSPSVPPSMSPSLNPSRSPSASPTVKWDARIQFNATDGENGDYYGFSVGVSDYTIIAGAPHNDEIEKNSGAAYILQKNENSGAWEEIQKITASDAIRGGQFGMNVALSEDVIVVCSGKNGDFDSRATYVFEFDENDDKWVEKDRLPLNEGRGGYCNPASNSVAVSGTTIVAGFFGGNAVHIFNRNENTGKWALEQKFEVYTGNFGFSVGVSGNVIVVGDPSSNAYIGSAYVYEFNNSSGLWDQTGELTPKDNQGNERFGWSVGVYENIIIIGAPHTNYIGSAYIFEKNITGSWVEVKRLDYPDYIQGTYYSYYFGWSVGVFNDYAVIGCRYTNCDGPAFVYRRDLNGNWDEIPKKLPTTDHEDRDSVGISGNAIAIGSPKYNSNMNGAVLNGSVSIFE